MIEINKIHHIAIISSDYERSKLFYTQILGFEIEREIFRKERDSFKLDLSLKGQYMIELFSFPNPPERLSRPEGTGLRHLAFEVDDLESSIDELAKNGVEAEPVRIDEMTHKKFTFFFDPDDLPIELYER
jgi:glyoxylase I family protein